MIAELRSKSLHSKSKENNTIHLANKRNKMLPKKQINLHLTAVRPTARPPAPTRHRARPTVVRRTVHRKTAKIARLTIKRVEAKTASASAIKFAKAAAVAAAAKTAVHRIVKRVAAAVLAVKAAAEAKVKVLKAKVVEAKAKDAANARAVKDTVTEMVTRNTAKVVIPKDPNRAALIPNRPAAGAKKAQAHQVLQARAAAAALWNTKKPATKAKTYILFKIRKNSNVALNPNAIALAYAKNKAAEAAAAVVKANKANPANLAKEARRAAVVAKAKRAAVVAKAKVAAVRKVAEAKEKERANKPFMNLLVAEHVFSPLGQIIFDCFLTGM